MQTLLAIISCGGQCPALRPLGRGMCAAAVHALVFRGDVSACDFVLSLRSCPIDGRAPLSEKLEAAEKELMEANTKVT